MTMRPQGAKKAGVHNPVKAYVGRNSSSESDGGPFAHRGGVADFAWVVVERRLKWDERFRHCSDTQLAIKS